jgi:hypothetical protein
MRLEEMVQHVQQGHHVVLVATVLRTPDIVDNHVPDFFAAMLLG